jgi:glycosyltransferase involved in cell wall biosynthesis
MNKMRADLSLCAVLPAHNEEENIEATVNQCVSYLEKNVGKYQVIVVNDGSSDNTRGIVDEIASGNPSVILVNHEVNRGYGGALLSGFEKASLDYIFFMDSDGQFDISDLDRMLPAVNESDVLIGYREDRADSVLRSLNAWLYAMYIYIMFGLRVKDMDCAFKVFPTKSYHSVRPIKSGGALFTAEFLIKLKNRGFKLKEFPIRHFPRRFGTQSGANIGVILRMFKESWELRNELR